MFVDYVHHPEQYSDAIAFWDDFTLVLYMKQSPDKEPRFWDYDFIYFNLDESTNERVEKAIDSLRNRYGYTICEWACSDILRSMNTMRSFKKHYNIESHAYMDYIVEYRDIRSGLWQDISVLRNDEFYVHLSKSDFKLAKLILGDAVIQHSAPFYQLHSELPIAPIDNLRGLPDNMCLKAEEYLSDQNTQHATYYSLQELAETKSWGHDFSEAEVTDIYYLWAGENIAQAARVFNKDYNYVYDQVSKSAYQNIITNNSGHNDYFDSESYFEYVPTYETHIGHWYRRILEHKLREFNIREIDCRLIFWAKEKLDL